MYWTYRSIRCTQYTDELFLANNHDHQTNNHKTNNEITTRLANHILFPPSNKSEILFDQWTSRVMLAWSFKKIPTKIILCLKYQFLIY